MASKRKGDHPNLDLRHRVSGPLPPVAEVEAELRALLTPALLAPRRLERRDPRNPDLCVGRTPRALLPRRVARPVATGLVNRHQPCYLCVHIRYIRMGDEARNGVKA